MHLIGGSGSRRCTQILMRMAVKSIVASFSFLEKGATLGFCVREKKLFEDNLVLRKLRNNRLLGFPSKVQPLFDIVSI